MEQILERPCAKCRDVPINLGGCLFLMRIPVVYRRGSAHGGVWLTVVMGAANTH